MNHALDLMHLAARVAEEAGDLIRTGRSDAEVALTKTSDVDIVTQMDLASERLVRERLAQARPDDGFLGEEGGHEPGTSGITWVVDPIDGTVNYLYGLPTYAVSIAAVSGSADPATWTPVAAALSDAHGVLWTAAAGQGAWRDGKQLTRTSAPALGQTLLATGFQYIAERRMQQGEVVAKMLGRVRDIRRLGAAAPDMCLAAAGQLDAYFERGLKPWDMAAASLLATEAGLKVAHLDGGPATEDALLAAMPGVWEDLRDALLECGADEPWRG